MPKLPELTSHSCVMCQLLIVS